MDSLEECDSGPECQTDCRRIAIPIAQCGNGIVELREECDDGNGTGGDGCSAVCKKEPKIQIAVCGNGQQELGEHCDDGNTADGDGCSALCAREERALEPVLEQPEEPDTEVAGVSETSTTEKPSAPEQPVAQFPEVPQLPEQPTVIAASLQPVQANVAPTDILQWISQFQSVAPPVATSTTRAPVGDTGPASLIVMVSGMAAGMGWARRKRQSKKSR